MKKHYDSRDKLNIYANFDNNNNKNQRNDINYKITSMKLNVTIRDKKKLKKNCITSVNNQIISYENIRRVIIYNVENSMLY